MRQSRGRRMNATSGYIGFGNKTSVFTRRGKLPFSKVKEIYGDELERYTSTRASSTVSHRKLTEEERLLIKELVIKQYKKRHTRELIAVIIILIIILGFVAVVSKI